MNCLELFKEFETKSFEANGFYAYDDFLELIKRSFLSPKAKERYVALYLDRLRAVRYRFIK